MDDMPPSFATQAPSIFDSSLPKLSDEDVDRLKRQLPQLAEHFNLPDTSAIVNFFGLLKDDKDDCDKMGESKRVEEKLMRMVTEAGVASNLDQNLLKAIENEVPVGVPPGLTHIRDLDR